MGMMSLVESIGALSRGLPSTLLYFVRAGEDRECVETVGMILI